MLGTATRRLRLTTEPRLACRCSPALRPRCPLPLPLLSPVAVTPPRRGLASAAAEEDQGMAPSLPLHQLVKAGDSAAVAARLAASGGGEVDSADPALNGTTPLLLAMRLGHDGVAEALLEAGADAGRAGAWGLTPLMYGAVFGRESVVASILRRNPDVDLYAVCAHGSTALAYAQAERQHGVVSLLVEHQASRGEGDDQPVAEMRSEGVTHSESGYNIRPMSTAQVEGAARRLSPLAHSVSLEAATEPPFQGVTVDGTRWDGGERGGRYCGAVSGLPLFHGPARSPAAPRPCPPAEAFAKPVSASELRPWRSLAGRGRQVRQWERLALLHAAHRRGAHRQGLGARRPGGSPRCQEPRTPRPRLCESRHDSLALKP